MVLSHYLLRLERNELTEQNNTTTSTTYIITITINRTLMNDQLLPLLINTIVALITQSFLDFVVILFDLLSRYWVYLL